MEKKEIVDGLKREQVKLELASKISKLLNHMVSSIGNEMYETVKNNAKVEQKNDYSKTYKKVPWLWK